MGGGHVLSPILLLDAGEEVAEEAERRSDEDAEHKSGGIGGAFAGDGRSTDGANDEYNEGRTPA